MSPLALLVTSPVTLAVSNGHVGPRVTRPRPDPTRPVVVVVAKYEVEVDATNAGTSRTSTRGAA
jgi:hypothetical protein